MGKLLLGLIFIALIIGACYLIYRIGKFFTDRRRQRLVARNAPDLLRYENIDSAIAEQIIDDRKALEQVTNIVSQMLNDPVMLIPTEYAQPLEHWLENRKEIGK